MTATKKEQMLKKSIKNKMQKPKPKQQKQYQTEPYKMINAVTVEKQVTYWLTVLN